MTPDVRILDMGDLVTRVLSRTNGSDLFHLVAIFGVEYRDSRPSDPRTPKHRYADTNSFSGLLLFCSSCEVKTS